MKPGDEESLKSSGTAQPWRVKLVEWRCKTLMGLSIFLMKRPYADAPMFSVILMPFLVDLTNDASLLLRLPSLPPMSALQNHKKEGSLLLLKKNEAGSERAFLSISASVAGKEREGASQPFLKGDRISRLL